MFFRRFFFFRPMRPWLWGPPARRRRMIRRRLLF